MNTIKVPFDEWYLADGTVLGFDGENLSAELQLYTDDIDEDAVYRIEFSNGEYYLLNKNTELDYLYLEVTAEMLLAGDIDVQIVYNKEMINEAGTTYVVTKKSNVATWRVLNSIEASREGEQAYPDILDSVFSAYEKGKVELRFNNQTKAVQWSYMNTGEWVNLFQATEITEGYSPTVTVQEIEGGHRINITSNENGRIRVQYFDVMDGIDGQNGTDGVDGTSVTVSTEEIYNGVRLIFTDKDGDHTCELHNGSQGQTGETGPKGDAGYSPTITTVRTDWGNVLQIWNEDGSKQTVDIYNGTQGPKGDTGETGPQGEIGLTGEDGFSPIAEVEEIDNEVVITITDKDGTTTAAIPINDNVVKTYDNVNELKADTGLTEGKIVKTAGYYSENDNGGAEYLICSDTANGYTVLSLNNGLSAKLIYDDEILVDQVGAKTFDDNFDNGVIVNGLYACLSTREKNYVKIRFTNAKYVFKTGMVFDSNVYLVGSQSEVQVSTEIYGLIFLEPNSSLIKCTSSYNIEGLTLISKANLFSQDDWNYRPSTPYNIFHNTAAIENVTAIDLSEVTTLGMCKHLKIRGFTTGVKTGNLTKLQDVYITRCYKGVYVNARDNTLDGVYISNGHTGYYIVDHGITMYNCWVDCMEGCGIENTGGLNGIIECQCDHISYSALKARNVSGTVTCDIRATRCGMYMAGMTKAEILALLKDSTQEGYQEYNFEVLCGCSAISVYNDNYGAKMKVNAAPYYLSDSPDERTLYSPAFIYNAQNFKNGLLWGFSLSGGSEASNEVITCDLICTKYRDLRGLTSLVLFPDGEASSIQNRSHLWTSGTYGKVRFFKTDHEISYVHGNITSPNTVIAQGTENGTIKAGSWKTAIDNNEFDYYSVIMAQWVSSNGLYSGTLRCIGSSGAIAIRPTSGDLPAGTRIIF